MAQSIRHYLRMLRFYYVTLGIKGVYGVLKSKLVGRTVEISVRCGDLPFPLMLRMPSSDVVTYESIFKHRSYAVQVSGEPKVIIDAGANIGISTTYFAARFPAARIFAIEPEEENFRLLQKNIAPYPNVAAIQAAIWSADGQVNLVDPGLGAWGFMTQPADNAGDTNIMASVRAVTLDTLLAEIGVDHVDILKMDIEGAEREVFSAAAAAGGWPAKIESMIVELHERLKPGCESAFEPIAAGFSERWTRGENIVLSRNGFLKKS